MNNEISEKKGVRVENKQNETTSFLAYMILELGKNITDWHLTIANWFIYT